MAFHNSQVVHDVHFQVASEAHLGENHLFKSIVVIHLQFDDSHLCTVFFVCDGAGRCHVAVIDIRQGEFIALEVQGTRCHLLAYANRPYCFSIASQQDILALVDFE